MIDNKLTYKEFQTVEIRQKKTGAKVSIPVSSELKSILERYDYQLPHLEDQVLNRYIKDICRLAGLDELIEIQTTKGGRAIKEFKHKWELVHSHTARRTGATLMYLAGMDYYDIMRITGHTSPTMLKKYIKADSIEVLPRLLTSTVTLTKYFPVREKGHFHGWEMIFCAPVREIAGFYGREPSIWGMPQ